MWRLYLSLSSIQPLFLARFPNLPRRCSSAPDEETFKRVLAERVVGRVLEEIAVNRACEEEEV